MKLPLLDDVHRQGTTMRLQVYLAHAGVCSRRAAAQIITEGRVSINKVTVTIPGTRVNPLKDYVTIDKQPCVIRKEYVFFMMNKPRKVESTNQSHTYDINNTDNRRTVKDIISRYFEGHIYSVGRLDYHSSGLLLFTTDGILCNHLTHPKYRVERVYRLETKEPLPEKAFTQWLQGIKIEGQIYTLTRYNIITPTTVELILQEGKNREIRKICEKYHVHIKKLHRIQFGPLYLGSLKGGATRRLTRGEVLKLYNITGLTPPAIL